VPSITPPTGQVNAIAPFMPSPVHRPSGTLSSDDGPFLFHEILGSLA